jgi:hypothetical protein
MEGSMRFSEIAERITGYSGPVFGASWEPPQLDRERAQEVIGWLSGRPVVYDPSESELPEQAVLGVSGLRKHLNVELSTRGIANELGDCLRAMREACEVFADAYDKEDPESLGEPLGKLREEFGWNVAVIAVRHGIDVPDELATILPLGPAHDGEQ